MIGANAVTDWVPPQLQRRNGYVCTGAEVTDFAGSQGGWLPMQPNFALQA
jgi:thioredoxin reductase (NADPH)